MSYPPRIVLLMLFLIMLVSSACPARQDVGSAYPPKLPTRSLPQPAPDDTVYPPQFEDPELVVDWAQPIAPEGIYNEETPYVVDFKFTPDGQYFLYTVRHPGLRWLSLYSVSLADGEPILIDRGLMEVSNTFYYEPTADSQRVLYAHGFDENILSVVHDLV